MPLAVFLVSVVFSTLLIASSARIIADAAENQAFMDSASASLAASSEGALTWSDSVFDSSTDVLKEFFSVERFDELSDVVLNQGIEVSAVAQFIDGSHQTLLPRWRQSGAELLLYDVSPEDAVEEIGMDYCLGRQSNCPDLVIEWFRFDRNFQFQRLAELEDPDAQSSVGDACMDWPEYGVQRCVWKKGMSVPSQLDFTPFLDVDFWHSFRLETHFPAYRYLVRVRSLDRQVFDFRLFGMRAGEKVALPQSVLEVDQLSSTRRSFRRTRDQRQLSAGLQDGLEFVHYSHELGDK